MSSKTYLPGSANCNVPTAAPLQAQDVSVLTVLTAWTSNYLNPQWDQGANILFNSTLFAQKVSGVDHPSPSITLPDPVVQVAECL